MTQTLTAQGRSPGSLSLPRFIPFLLLLLAACAPPPLPTGEADINVALQAVTASDVSKVTLTVSASDISPSIVRDLQSAGGGKFKAILGGLPTGTNRTFLAQAFDASGVKLYEGQATGVTVSTGDTVSVVILLQQSTPPTPFVNSAPRLTGLTAAASQVKPGQAITLTATATDADGDALTYTWSTTGGTFSSTSVANPTWTAPAAGGTYTLSVSVADNRGGQAGMSLSIDVLSRGSANVSVSFNAWPVVSQVKGTPSGQVAPGGIVNLDVTAVEPDGDALTYSWADDCGGGFDSPGVKTPIWTAPFAAPTGGVCKVTVTVKDGKGGSTTGQLGLGVGLPAAFNRSPIIDQTFQSNNLVVAGDKVNLNVDAHDPEGTAVTFTWSASGGTLGTPTTSGTHSEIVWTAPTQINAYTITVVVQDAAGQKTTQTFTADFGLQNCVRVVTSYLKEVNPYSSSLTVAYSMVGGGGGGSNLSTAGSGSKASGTFTLGSGNLEVFVGGGGGLGSFYLGGPGGGGAGYYGGGSGGNGGSGQGSGGGGGSSAILSGGLLVNVAAGGWGSESMGGGGGSTTGGVAGWNNYGSNPTAGTAGAGGHSTSVGGGTGLNGGASTRYDAGGGGGYGGGGGGGGSTASSPGGTGGSSGGNGGGTGGGLGANTWSAATTLPTDAGAVNPGGGNAGLVILTYTALSCQL